ncbi:MAG: hypothetical protein AAFU79_01255 [Myxococcota bacterium]
MLAPVLMDLSVLSTHSRLRGIGRYVRDLGLALDALGPAQRGFELRALTDVGGMWSPAVTAAGVTAAISAFDAAALARPHRPWAQRMRARLPRASRTFDHGLLHLGNPDATPRRALALPTVPTCHDLIPLRYPKEYLRRIWDGFEVRRRFGWPGGVGRACAGPKVGEAAPRRPRRRPRWPRSRPPR